MRAEAKASARTLISDPVGRAVQAAVCKAAEAGAIPARDSSLRLQRMERAKAVAPKHEACRRTFLCRDWLRLGKPFSTGIDVDRHTSVFQTEIVRALLSCPSIFRGANTGAGQDFTDLAAAVQLRLRVRDPCGWPPGLQTLTVKSRLLTGEKCLRTAIRCESAATHHFRIMMK